MFLLLNPIFLFIKSIYSHQVAFLQLDVKKKYFQIQPFLFYNETISFTIFPELSHILLIKNLYK